MFVRNARAQVIHKDISKIYIPLHLQWYKANMNKVHIFCTIHILQIDSKNRPCLRVSIFRPMLNFLKIQRYLMSIATRIDFPNKAFDTKYISLRIPR